MDDTDGGNFNEYVYQGTRKINQEEAWTMDTRKRRKKSSLMSRLGKTCVAPPVAIQCFLDTLLELNYRVSE